ncbi:MAG: hypothetical protein KF769_03815 [Parvibaculum sp.]|uniref:hypothetical protein n=1 Tax=Parvibaculum sp. TaxID=2024848 RepID=UPI001D411324|nr:hypothetical protein [Parvibaculum sp.]MBX3490437.1 hypothetical protein [Parvibaculum sp.]MBX3495347.1 hypothetical protein [Parvibaculum sp.]MCW5728295.1 hypothetical protein [Parvibaculum sp.]
MESITLSGLVVLASLSGAMTGMPAEAEISKPPSALQTAQASCSLSGEQRAGARKYCYYNCGETVRTVVVAAGRVCPASIRR